MMVDMYHEDYVGKCPKCGKEYKPNKYEPKYDRYGMMGSGWVHYVYCDDCLEEE